ncbi:MAG: polysaccharide deacetylase family protein [Oleispira sp.]|nr:polysaccharide deacetylase family protein [Oleispira sp.]MBL4880072.1 polysaccharide deacetylase family protein [Oleispira sp.]
MMKIKRIIKYFIALACHFTGFNYWRIWHLKKHYILMFHRLEEKQDALNISIPVNYFSLLTKWSSGIGELVSMSTLIDAQNPKVRFCITFDDGFKTVSQVGKVAPGIPYILYLSTAYIDSEKEFWAIELEKIMYESNLTSLNLASFNLNEYDLSSDLKKKHAVSMMNYDVKKLHPADIEAVMKYLRLILAINNNDTEDNCFLKWGEVKEMHDKGMEVGGHTHNHIISSRVSPPEFETDIRISNKVISKHLGFTPKHFAYPNGRKQDISVFSRQILIDEGYLSAVTTIEGANNVNDNPYLLKRFNVSVDRIANPWGYPSKAMFTTMLVNPLRLH